MTSRAAADRRWCCRKRWQSPRPGTRQSTARPRRFTRAIGIAEQLGDTPRRLRLLVGLHIFLMRGGEVGRFASGTREVWRRKGRHRHRSVPDTAVADCLLGSSHHFEGHQVTARKSWSGLPRRAPRSGGCSGLTPDSGDGGCSGGRCGCQAFWIDLSRLRETLALAEGANRPLSVCFAYPTPRRYLRRSWRGQAGAGEADGASELARAAVSACVTAACTPRFEIRDGAG